MYLFPLLRSLSTLNYFYLQFTMIYFMYKLLVFIVSYKPLFKYISRNAILLFQFRRVHVGDWYWCFITNVMTFRSSTSRTDTCITSSTWRQSFSSWLILSLAWKYRRMTATYCWQREKHRKDTSPNQN